MNTTGSVTLLHKLITLQNLYSSFLSNNAQALKEGKPLPEQLSINLFKLIYLINSNSLINRQFDILNINHSFQVINNTAQQNNNPYVPALSITDIIKIIIEVLGKDSIIIPQQSSSNKDKQLLRLSPQISLDFIKQNLGEMFVAYKKETLQQIEMFENDYKLTMKELELIENGKIEDKILQEEYLKNLKLKQPPLILAPAVTTTPLVPLVPPKPAPVASSQVQTPAPKRQAQIPSTPQTAPPATRKQLSVSTPSLQILPSPAVKTNVPATLIKPTSATGGAGVHRLTTRSLDRKIEVMETPILKQKELMKNEIVSTSEEEAEKQKILEEIEDSLIGSDKETELDLKAETLKVAEKASEVSETTTVVDNSSILTEEVEKKAEVKDDADDNKNNNNDDENNNNNKKEESTETALSTPKSDELKREIESPTPEPVTPPKEVVELESEEPVKDDESDNDDEGEEVEDDNDIELEDKPKTRSSSRKRSRPVEEVLPISTRKRKRSETPAANDTPAKSHPPNKKFQTIALQLITQISAHRFASTFLQPVNVNDEPEYYSLIKYPQDLKTMTKEIKNGSIADFPHLERNLMLMFCNALMYNETDGDVSLLTKEMMHECEESIKTFKGYL